MEDGQVRWSLTTLESKMAKMANMATYRDGHLTGHLRRARSHIDGRRHECGETGKVLSSMTDKLRTGYWTSPDVPKDCIKHFFCAVTWSAVPGTVKLVPS
jgi:hypothetical protein